MDKVEESTGMELDAEVAEVVMGLQVEWMRSAGPVPKCPGYRNERGWFPTPHYSSSWEGLGLVVEEMERRDYTTHLESKTGSWIAFFDGGNPPRLGRKGRGATAPEAVARAALLALGGE